MFSTQVPRALGSSLFQHVASFPQVVKEQLAIMIWTWGWFMMLLLIGNGVGTHMTSNAFAYYLAMI